MKKAMIMSAAVGAAMLSTGAVQAQQTEGPWMVRARVVNIMPANESDATATLPADAVTLNNVVAPEVDFTYFFTKNIAAELILTYPQKHNVDLAGVGQIGTVKHLPPTLTLQYHFLPDGQYRPYIGAGINYTRFSSVNLNAAGTPLYLENSSTGGALQIGMDVKLSSNLYLNFDLKYLWIGTDVTTATGAKVTHLNINPWLPGIGLGWRF